MSSRGAWCDFEFSKSTLCWLYSAPNTHTESKNSIRTTKTINNLEYIFICWRAWRWQQCDRSCISRRKPAFILWSRLQLHAKEFTIITESEASIALMENNSISSRVCPSDEKCIRCYVHVLQKRLKSVFSFSANHACLQKLSLISNSSIFSFYYYLYLLGSYCWCIPICLWSSCRISVESRVHVT